MAKALIIGMQYDGACLLSWKDDAVCETCGKIGCYVYSVSTSTTCPECAGIWGDNVWEVELIKEWS